jgi:hypothetical protein
VLLTVIYVLVATAVSGQSAPANPSTDSHGNVNGSRTYYGFSLSIPLHRVFKPVKVLLKGKHSTGDAQKQHVDTEMNAIGDFTVADLPFPYNPNNIGDLSAPAPPPLPIDPDEPINWGDGGGFVPINPGGGGGGDGGDNSPPPTGKNYGPNPLVGAKQSRKEDACKTFKSMWERQNEEKKEQVAVLTDKGVIWLDDRYNDMLTGILPPLDAYRFINGYRCIYFNQQWQRVLSILHTHPTRADYPGGGEGVSQKDLAVSKQLGVPNNALDESGIWRAEADGTSSSRVSFNYSDAFDCTLARNYFDLN